MPLWFHSPRTSITPPHGIQPSPPNRRQRSFSRSFSPQSVSCDELRPLISSRSRLEAACEHVPAICRAVEWYRRWATAPQKSSSSERVTMTTDDEPARAASVRNREGIGRVEVRRSSAGRDCRGGAGFSASLRGTPSTRRSLVSARNSGRCRSAGLSVHVFRFQLTTCHSWTGETSSNVVNSSRKLEKVPACAWKIGLLSRAAGVGPPPD